MFFLPMKDVILEYNVIYISGCILHSILLIFTRGGKFLFNILQYTSVGLELWCLTPVSTIFLLFQFY